MHANPISLLWLRRDLRLHDHAALFRALQAHAPVQPVFIFDTGILGQFPAKADRRLSFLAQRLCLIHEALQKRGGGLLMLHGKAEELIPKLAHALHAADVCACEDYEPATRRRDAAVQKALGEEARLSLVKDQVIFSPTEVLREKDSPYKVFTPYAKTWRSQMTPLCEAPYPIKDKGRYADFTSTYTRAHAAVGNAVLDSHASPATLLESIGYTYSKDSLWQVDVAIRQLSQFIKNKAKSYATARNMMAEEGTSKLSPYIRFGLVSIRECVAAAREAGADVWLSELIWREFYAMILYHFPESAHTEWNPRYRGVLEWSKSETQFVAWQEGKTGYPVVDAAMRQLTTEGWMHNRARMIVASFLTKHLRIDWRKGEAHFAQYLMDYDLASNVGGWQWAASTGTDAQPYFRVFNPVLQSRKFDPDGEYIRKYVAELRHVKDDAIHAPWEHPMLVPYIPPIVDHAEARVKAIEMFKGIRE